MAMIGLRYMVASAVSTETAGTAITYGTGFVVGKAISAELNWERNDNPLYADDTIAENDNGITGGTLEIGVDDLSDAVRSSLLGEAEAGSSTGIYETGDVASPYVGIGYIRVRRKAGSTTYEAFWYHKAQFAENSESAQTRGQNIEWQTPTLSGRIMGAQVDSSMAITYRIRKGFSTEAAAQAWLKTKANIT